MSKKVVSRASRFHRSAGLEESFDRFKKSGRDSPAAGVVQGSNPGISGTPSSFSISSVGQQFSASPASPGIFDLFRFHEMYFNLNKLFFNEL